MASARTSGDNQHARTERHFERALDGCAGHVHGRQRTSHRGPSGSGRTCYSAPGRCVATFLVRREFRASYRARATKQAPPPGPIWRSATIWCAVSLLYVWMFPPADIAADTRTCGRLSPCFGVLTMLDGLVLERGR